MPDMFLKFGQRQATTCIILAGLAPPPHPDEERKVSGVYLYKSTGKFGVKVNGKQMFQARSKHWMDLRKKLDIYFVKSCCDDLTD